MVLLPWRALLCLRIVYLDFQSSEYCVYCPSQWPNTQWQDLNEINAKKSGNETLAQDACRNMTLANSIQTMATPFLRALSPATGAEARFNVDQVHVQYFETDMQAAADSVSDLISAIHTQSYYRFADCTTVAKGLSDGAIPHAVLFLQDLCSSYL